MTRFLSVLLAWTTARPRRGTILVPEGSIARTFEPIAADLIVRERTSCPSGDGCAGCDCNGRGGDG